MRRYLSALFALGLLFAAALPVAAQRSTTYTYTPNPKGEGYFPTRTGDAYLPRFTITDLGMDEPQDLFIDADDLMYIADAANKRVLVYDIGIAEVAYELLHEEFVYPTGVWRNDEGILYVADPKAEKVFCFDGEGTLVREYGTPTEASFGGRNFAPRKISVDDAGNLFIIGEGFYDGVIQLSPTGAFLGYFTSNKIDLSFTERLQDLLFTDAQKANLLDRSPVTFSNLFVDQRNILYTTSIGDSQSALKKHNAAGAAIVTGYADEDAAPMDIWVTDTEIMIAVFANGATVIYSREGDYIAEFGYSYNNRDDRAGLFSRPSSVAMDSTGSLWYLDEEKAFLQSYEPTDYIRNIYSALDLFEAGDYQASIEIWKEVLKVNQISRIAHLSIGKNYLFMRDYETAMFHSRIANDRDFYSQSYWEIRNLWLQRNVIFMVLGIILLFIVGPIYRAIRRRAPALAAVERPFRRARQIKFVDDLMYQFHVMRKPNDGFYYIRKGRKGSLLAAALIVAGFFVVFMFFIAGKGFVYQEVLAEDIDFTSVIIGFFGGIFLFLFSNYLGTSINDGRGDMKDLFMMFAYSLAPLWIAMALVIGMSYVLTLNEVFALNLIMIIGWSWWAVQLVLGLREVHEYNTRSAIMSIVFSIAFMLVLLIVTVIITVMGQQVYQFFLAIAKELLRNVGL
jgi:tetratricopeptide (TPR) repeat protein